MILLRRVGPAGNYVTEVLPGVLLLAVGLATTVAPLTATALSSAPTEHAGMASAVNNDVARTASLIAVAVLPALAGITGATYLHPTELVHGFRSAVMLAGVAAAAGGLIGVLFIRNPTRAARPGVTTPTNMCCPLEATPMGQYLDHGAERA